MIKRYFRCLSLIFFALAFLTGTLSMPMHTAALSDKQKALFNKGVLYYNIDECAGLNSQDVEVGGGPIYMMGDSITAGAKNDLETEFKNAKLAVSKINGVVSRSFVSKGEGSENGLEALNSDSAAIKNSNTVILALGTNSEDADGESSTFKNNARAAVDKVTLLNPNAKIYWVEIFSDSPPIKQKNDYNKVIDGLDGVTPIEADREGGKPDGAKVAIPLADKIHPTAEGYKKYAKAVAAAVKGGGAAAVTSSELDGHKLPATQGGVGKEEPITTAGNIVGKSNKVSFPQHASKGKEYRDYYINMRWNYVKWNWDGTTTDANDEEFNWFSDQPRLVLVTNPVTKKSIIAAALDAGPAPWTGVDTAANNDPKQGWVNPQSGTPDTYKGRVSGLPPQAFKALGMTSEDIRIDGNGPDLLYAWAPDQNAKPGPTTLSVDGTTSRTSASDECKCKTSGATTGVGGDVDKFIKALAYQESGGDPTQPGSAGGARGKYQYIDSTWKSSAETYYKPALQYTTANAAPESVQDAVAFLEYSKKFKDLDNDLFKLAVSHFYPIANTNPGLLDQVPPSNVITPRQYASKLLNSIKNGGPWEKIPLKYQDAPEFSKYAKDVSASGASVSDPSGSTLSADLCSSEFGQDNTGGVEGISWPVDKKYWTSNPDWFTKPHHDYPAADIPVSHGTKIYSMVDGKVTLAGSSGGCGVSVFVKYEGGVEIGFCHGTPGSLKVKAGDTVRSGQLVMLSDNTGSSTGDHLHLQIKINGVLHCPQQVFKNLAADKKTDFSKLPTSGCSY